MVLFDYSGMVFFPGHYDVWLVDLVLVFCLQELGLWNILGVKIVAKVRLIGG